MTETEQTDNLAKKILAGSRLEIMDTGLTDHIMQKIMLHEKNKMLQRAILCSFLGLCTLGVVLFLAVQNIDSPKQFVNTLLQNTANLFAHNQMIIPVILVIPIILSLVFQRITRGKIQYY